MGVQKQFIHKIQSDSDSTKNVQVFNSKTGTSKWVLNRMNKYFLIFEQIGRIFVNQVIICFLLYCMISGIIDDDDCNVQVGYFVPCSFLT